MKRNFLRWLYRSLRNFEYRLTDWLINYDLCELCHSASTDTSCIGCGARICYGCDSNYYSDETLCKACRAAMTPEEIERDRLEAIATACESGCHLKTCPSTRPHDQHTDECAKCNCEEENSPCNKDCAPSGYTGTTVEQ